MTGIVSADGTGPSAGPEGSAAATTPPAVRVTVVGRDGCHLCHDAEAVVAQVCGELGVGWTTVSIDDDPQLHARYWEQIPVILVDGRHHDYWRVDAARLRAALEPIDR